MMFRRDRRLIERRILRFVGHVLLLERAELCSIELMFRLTGHCSDSSETTWGSADRGATVVRFLVENSRRQVWLLRLLKSTLDVRLLLLLLRSSSVSSPMQAMSMQNSSEESCRYGRRIGPSELIEFSIQGLVKPWDLRWRGASWPWSVDFIQGLGPLMVYLRGFSGSSS